MDENEGTPSFVPPAIDDLNQWLSGYQIVKLLACGGMGAVYQARQISLDREVAIKILPPELAVNESFRKSFEAEGKAMAKVAHPNLVGVYDFGEISNMLYLVIEFVEGSTLHESKGDSAIDAEVAVSLIRSIASGLAEAHRRGMVHRDIKPANILINADLVPKLGDFGLAVPDSDIESGLVMGTPAYLAPEVLQNPAKASFASDTYALGVILYEMLTGSSIERGEIIDLSRVPKLGTLPTIVRKAIDPKPLLRYQNGSEMEEALKEWMSKPKGAVPAMKPGMTGPRPNVRPTVSQESGGGGGFLLGLAALVILGGLAWATFGRGSQADEDADLSSPPATPEITVDPQTPSDLESLDDQRSAHLKAVEELSLQIAEERANLRREFLEAAGEEGVTFLESAPKNSPDLPRYFLPGEVVVSQELLPHLLQFAGSGQKQLDRKFQRELSSLHRKLVRKLKDASEEFPKDFFISWETWIEWLGKNPLEVMQTSMAGQWRSAKSQPGASFQLSSTGKNTLVLDQESPPWEDVLVMTKGGSFSLQHPDLKNPRFPWKLHWRGDRLQGENSRGAEQVLLLEDFDYATLLKKPEKTEIPPEEMATPTNEDSDDSFKIKDPEIAALTENYRKALASKIEPLETGYLRVLNRSKGAFQNDRDSLTQIEDEEKQIKEMPWREGFTFAEALLKEGDLPADLHDEQTLFLEEFQKRYEPLHRTYLTSLKKMLRVRKGRGSTDIEEIEEIIKLVEIPEGAVKARYIKIESLPDEGTDHATISMIEIVDLKGELLPRADFTDLKVSSYEKNDEGREMLAEYAIDGNPKTFWHSHWHKPAAEFPHWLSFDLGGNQWITGFHLTSREYKDFRSTDITNWRFHVSMDGETWTVVAAGNFPKGNQTNKHHGFKVDE